MTNAIELAKQAGAETSDGIHWEFDDFDPIKFAKLVRNQTLEEAAHKLPHIISNWRITGGPPTVSGEQHVADAIESLKEPTP